MTFFGKQRFTPESPKTRPAILVSRTDDSIAAAWHHAIWLSGIQSVRGNPCQLGGRDQQWDCPHFPFSFLDDKNPNNRVTRQAVFLYCQTSSRINT